MSQATDALWTWCYRPWPVKAAMAAVGSVEWTELDAKIARYVVEKTEAGWLDAQRQMGRLGYLAREVFRYHQGEKPEPIAW